MDRAMREGDDEIVPGREPSEPRVPTRAIGRSWRPSAPPVMESALFPSFGSEQKIAIAPAIVVSGPDEPKMAEPELAPKQAPKEAQAPARVRELPSIEPTVPMGMPPREVQEVLRSIESTEQTKPLEWAIAPPPPAAVSDTAGKKQRYEPAHAPPRAHESTELPGPTVRFRSESTKPVQSNASKSAETAQNEAPPAPVTTVRDELAERRAQTRRDELVDAFFDTSDSDPLADGTSDLPPASDHEGAALAELWTPQQARRRRRASTAVIVVVAAGISLLGAGLALRGSKSTGASPVSLHVDAGEAAAPSAPLDVPLISPPPAPAASDEAPAQAGHEGPKSRLDGVGSPKLGFATSGNTPKVSTIYVEPASPKPQASASDATGQGRRAKDSNQSSHQPPTAAFPVD